MNEKESNGCTSHSTVALYLTCAFCHNGSGIFCAHRHPADHARILLPNGAHGYRIHARKMDVSWVLPCAGEVLRIDPFRSVV